MTPTPDTTQRRNDPTRSRPLVYLDGGHWHWLCTQHDRHEHPHGGQHRAYAEAQQHANRRHL